MTSPAAIWLISSSGSSRMPVTEEGGAVTSKAGESEGGGFTESFYFCSVFILAVDNARLSCIWPSGDISMEIISFLIDFIVHIDKHILTFVQAYGPWVYALLFLVVFVETGLVVMPFLPGDSLLFIVGALGATGSLHVGYAVLVLMAAAILGDQVNFSIGRRVGPRVFQWEDSRLFNRKAFDKAHAFYERYGGITVVLARFMPFIRTFVPFVAGVAAMHRSRFTLFNMAGGVLWVCGVTAAGYLFGNIPWVKGNLEIIIWSLILVPGGIALYGAWKAGRTSDGAAPRPRSH